MQNHESILIPGSIHPIRSIEGSLDIAESILINLDLEPPQTIEAEVTHVELGFTGVVLARLALQQGDAIIPAKSNTSSNAPHKGTLTIET